MSLNVRILLFFFIFFNIDGLNAQSLPDTVVKKIDSLFSRWNNDKSPGCTIGIIRNDSLIYARGYGLANLEYAIPNTPSTIFHIASLSKQFTAYSIVLLAEQHKLQLDDDVRKYLSWFPDLKKKITIRHLLHHTSGVRDQWQLLAISGTRLDDVITQDQIIKILSKQEALNFEPGEQYSYSNSGYTMLAEIVRSVTGQSIREFTDSAFFKPLGMTDTHFHDDYTEIVPNRSYSYQRKDSAHFINSILSYSTAGATSLFTNIPDMSKWVMNFYRPKVGNAKDIDTLAQKGRLNNGKELSYALGIAVDTYKGWKQYAHGGADAGYRTAVAVFPDLKMGFIVFSNLGDINAQGRLYSIANLFIKDTAQLKKEAAPRLTDSLAAVLQDTFLLHRYAGDYISEENIAANFEIRRSKLYYQMEDKSHFLIRKGKDTFYIPGAPANQFVFYTRAKDTMVDMITPQHTYHLKKYSRMVSPDDQFLKNYTGTYYCPELDCRYGIILKDHRLVLTNTKYPDEALTVINKDHLTDNFWWMDHLMMLRDNKNKITGFEVNSGRIMHLRFNRINN